MNKAQLEKIEQQTIEQIKTKPVSEIARMAFNTAGMDEAQFELIDKSIPNGLYRLPTSEYRRCFEVLEWVCLVSGLQFWRDNTLYQGALITESEFNGACLGLNDVLDCFQLDKSKAKVMGLGAFYVEMADHPQVIESHCPNKRKTVYDQIIQGAESMLK